MTSSRRAPYEFVACTGEVGITRACAAEGTIHMLPTLASCSLTEMLAAKVPEQTCFLQLYVNKDRSVTEVRRG